MSLMSELFPWSYRAWKSRREDRSRVARNRDHVVNMMDQRRHEQAVFTGVNDLCLKIFQCSGTKFIDLSVPPEDFNIVVGMLAGNRFLYKGQIVGDKIRFFKEF